VNSYQGSSGFKVQSSKFTEPFPQLLELLNSIKGNFWIRFLTSHPKDLSDQLIQAIAKLDKVAKSLHLAVQSGDNQILKKMNRKYTVEHFRELIRGVRKAVPDITISTDIIVGFPGETEKQFRNTVKLFKEIQFDMAYINRYSPREKTAAFRLKDNISLEEKKKRDRELNQILAEIAKKKNQRLVGKELTVLAEKKKDGYWFGKDNGFHTVKFRGGDNLIGKFVPVAITKGLAFGLEGMRAEGKVQRAESQKKLVVILGPTASGKTDWAKKLTQEFRGEIISADSRQVYQGLDVGTAKDKKFPQFLVDIKKPNQKFDLAEYQKLAYRKLAEIWQRKNLPFLVGGTGLYISAVVDGYVLPGDGLDSKLRHELESQNLTDLQKQLKKLDSTASGKIDLQNKRRVIRALEVKIKTGKSILEKRGIKKPDFDVLLLGIDISRKELYQRINQRVLKMIKEGLVNEVRKLYLKKYDFNQEAFSGIGYRQIANDFKNLSPKEIKQYQVPQKTIERIQSDTRHYAKRQLTWFKRDKRIRWVSNLSEARRLIREFISGQE
jgi:tRNA dimethylallyltransferase